MRPEPTLQGPYGKAWQVQHKSGGPKDWDAHIAQFQVNRPGAHMLWSWWVVACVHLRPIEGVPPAHKSYPEAEYEFLIMALDPDKPVPDPVIVEGHPHYNFLQPFDVVHQFHGVTDDEAKEVVRLAVKAIVEGGVSPDSDYRRLWKELLKNTVEHVSLGGHPKNTPA